MELHSPLSYQYGRIAKVADEGKLMPPKSTWFGAEAEKRPVYPQDITKKRGGDSGL